MPRHFPSRFVADAARIKGYDAILFRSARHLDENMVNFDPTYECSPVGNPEIVELSETAMERRDKGYTHRGSPVLTPRPAGVRKRATETEPGAPKASGDDPAIRPSE